MRALLIVILLAVSGTASAQSLEITSGIGFGAFDVHGRLADKNVWHGGIAIDAHLEARSHEWSLSGGGGAHWGAQDHTYLGWHVELGRHLPLWRTTRVLAHEYNTLRLEAGANVGLDSGKLIDGVNTLARLGGWHVGADLDFRFVGRTSPHERVGYVMAFTLSIARTVLSEDSPFRVPPTEADQLLLTICFLGGGS
jgi:hypothetical protein